MKEILAIFDEKLNEIGAAARLEVHTRGLIHQVVHCWIIETKSSVEWIYLQQRSYEKEDFPGFYDISAAGHIDAGENPEAAGSSHKT